MKKILLISLIAIVGCTKNKGTSCTKCTIRVVACVDLPKCNGTYDKPITDSTICDSSIMLNYIYRNTHSHGSIPNSVGDTTVYCQ